MPTSIKEDMEDINGFRKLILEERKAPEEFSKVQAVQMYESSDGKVFRELADAEYHESVLAFTEWYENNKIYGGFEGCKIESEYFLDWLDNLDEEGRRWLKKVLG